LKGGIDSVNLNAASNVVTSIIAGTRSGKGVLTMSIYASLIAAGNPVVYLDNKPDMASVLWDLERDFTASGVPTKIACYDASGTNGAEKGYKAVRAHPPERPACFGGSSEGQIIASITPYLKALLFGVVLAKLRSTGRTKMTPKVFFVLDEAQVTNGACETLRKELLAAIKKPLKGEEESETSKYARRYYKVLIQGLTSNTILALNTYAGKGKLGYILLGQQINVKSWGADGVFRKIYDSATIILRGSNAGNVGSSSIENARLAESKKEMLTKIGYFLRTSTLSTATLNKDSYLNIIKSFVLLKKNDFQVDLYNS